MTAWRFLPADNLLISFEAKYADGQTRRIRFHREFEPGFNVVKSCRLIIPDADEIVNHPRMCFVSAGEWKQGQNRVDGPHMQPLWIDMYQITIGEYLPHLLTIFKQGQLQIYESVLLTAILRHSDLEPERLSATSIGDILSLLRTADSGLQCPECPAPMTEVEAVLLSKQLRKSIPCKNEWELAVRGVDGREFPWGDHIDRSFLNAGLPAGIGRAHGRRLRPSTDYPENESPFGVMDAVGNAGDWIEYEGRYRFMGGELGLNAEECTTYNTFPLLSEHAGLADFTRWRVGFRGVRRRQQTP